MYDTKNERENKPILIIPAAGKSSRFPNMKPKWMLTAPSGKLMIECVLDNIEVENYKKIYIVILKEHCEKYEADVILSQIFKNSQVEVVILNKQTNSSPETVVECIRQKNIFDNIVIKDCDCMVQFSLPATPNFIVGIDINTAEISNLSKKSFIVADDQNIVKEVIEKKIISELVCVGVYAAHSSLIEKTYSKILETNEMYFSDIISQLIDENVVFQCIFAKKYEDWGTSKEWFDSFRNKKTYIFDIDGVLLKNTGKYGRKNWFNTIEPIDENIKKVKELSDAGNEIIFMTSRTQEGLLLFKKYLKENNIQYKMIVSDCYHSKRILINDFASTNPYPSCEAINIKRNGMLEDYI
jgi:hypothetical protein